METNYSIIVIPIRPEIQERLSVGLLLIGEEGIFFKYSIKKLNIARALLTGPSFRLISDSLKSIEKSVYQAHNNKIKHPDVFDENQIETGNIISISYLEYLSRYNNNLITLTSPKAIQIPCTKDNFNKLYFKWIDNQDITSLKHKSSNSFNTIRKQFYPSLVNHYNVLLEVNTEYLPDLLLPIKIDLIGKNEKTVYAQAIDMGRKSHMVDSDIGKLMIIKQAVPLGKGFLISQEPNKTLIKPHQIWDSIRKSSLFEYIDISEKEKILGYAVEHGIQPLIES